MAKKSTLTFCIILLFSFMKAQQLIEPNLFGENAWYPTLYYGVSGSGQLDNNWTKISQAGVKMVRYGGTAFNANQPPLSDYTYHVNKIKGAGMIPVMQVAMGDLTTQTTYQTGSQAALVVQNLNSGGPSSSTYCKYWIIGNEPDLLGFTPQQIHDRIRDISQAMRTQNATYTTDPLIIIGPELAFYNNHPNTSNLTQDFVIDQLTSGPQYPSSAKDITSYIDIFSFHYYPFGSEQQAASTSASVFEIDATRFNVMNVIRNTNVTFGNGQPVTPVQKNISDFIADHPTLKLAVTEANICEKNDVNTTANPTGTNLTPDTDDLLTGNGSNGFIAGQFWAELLGVCMDKGVSLLNFWSSIEGDGSTNYETNIGFLNTDPNNYLSTAGAKKPSYWHFKMIADNFSAEGRPSYFYNPISINLTNVKAFASQSDNRIAVLIMNQQQSGSLPFKVRMNTGSSAGSNLDILFNFAGIASGTDYTSVTDIENQSTVLLLFDCKGNISERWDYKLSGVQGNPGGYSPSIVQVSSNPLLTAFPTVTFTGPSTLSTGNYGSFSMLPNSTGWSYSWSPAPVNISNNGCNVDLSAYVPGGTATYIYTAMDPEGCKASSGISITDGGVIVGSGFQAGICGPPTPSDCNMCTGSAKVCYGNGGPPNPYTTVKWDNNQTTATATGLCPGMHSVQVREYPSSYPLIRYVNIPVIGNLPPVSAGQDKFANRYCTVTLTASPNLTSSGYTYKWYKGTSTIPFSNSYTKIINAWNTSSYKVVVTAPASLGGCSNSSTVNLTVSTSQYCFVRPNNIHLSSLVCNSTGNGAGNGPITVINSSRIINSDQVIDNTIRVTNNAKLTITGSELGFASGTKIIVDPGAQLEIRDSYLHGCSNGKWDGIEIAGNNNVSNQLVITGSAFVDADYSIKTDKTIGILLDNNVFINGIAALTLERNKDFKITKNYFFNYDIGIKTKNTPISDVKSLIKENFFENVKTAISFENDNHTRLDIKCNTFKNYTQYAMLSSNTMLQDQGTTTAGAGNVFISSSSLANDKLKHQGNSMKYYYDPSNPISNGMNVTILPSSGDGCLSSSLRLAHDEDAQSIQVEQEKSKLLDIIPNPASEQATIIFNLGKESSTGEVVITNIYGEIILRYKIIAPATKVDVDCTKLSGGIYFTSLLVDGKITNTKKMMIAK